MPAWVLFPTFDQTVKQYGLHNLAPLIMLQVELSIKISDIHHVLSPSCTLYYDIPSSAAGEMPLPSIYLPDGHGGELEVARD